MSTNKENNIVLMSQGSIKERSTWQIGQLFLTTRRLYFKQTKHYLFDIELNKITKISIKKRTWLLGSRVRQLCIDYHEKYGEEHVFIALAKPEKWVLIIKNTMTLMLIEGCDYNGSKPESPNNS